jgi:hypothetical protein
MIAEKVTVLLLGGRLDPEASRTKTRTRKRRIKQRLVAPGEGQKEKRATALKGGSAGKDTLEITILRHPLGVPCQCRVARRSDLDHITSYMAMVST